MRILIVEDERVLADAIARGLRRGTMAVGVAYDGDEALERLGVNDYDVGILDRDLPGTHGDEVCRHLTSSGTDQPRVPMLTAAGDLAARVNGLGIGADDYLAKPFTFVELVARVRALGRRARPAAPPILERSSITLDPSRREVSRDGQPVALSRKEFAVLEELLRAGGAVVSAEQLLEKAWDENIDPFTNVARVTFMTLRRIALDGPHDELNRTVLEVALDDSDTSEDVRRLGRTQLATNARSERLVQNLIQNAIKHNEPDGWVQVTTGPEGLVMSNTGAVVPAYEIDALFEPFRRLQSVRTGSDRGVGLGLSIVKSITRAHGGGIVAEARPAGGLVMSVRLPSTDAADA